MTAGMLGHRLVIDIQTTQSVRYSERGIPRYAADYCLALLHAGAPVSAFMLNPVLPHPRRLPGGVVEAPQLRWNTAQTFRAVADQGPVAYHVMSTLESVRPVQATLPPFVMGSGVPLVCTVYDMIPEVLKVFEPGSSFATLYGLRREMIRRADLIFAISSSTRADIIRLLGVDAERVVEIGTGSSDFFRPPSPHERPTDLLAVHVPAVTRPYVLTVTGVFGLDMRKNTEGVMAAFASLPRDLRDAHQVVVACALNDEDEARWHALALELGLTEGQVVLTGFVPDVALRALYQQASVFVNASLYEGFGLPALEAARCGCPTITSNTSSLPEILEWSPATFDPTNREEMSTVMERALVDEDFRTDLLGAAAGASAKHTWKRVAAKALDGYARLDSPRRPRRPHRPRPPLRIALVGPFPPSASESAVFNQRLAAELAGRCELDCFADGPFDRPPAAGRRFRIFPGSAFGRFLSPYSYDAVFYTLANDPRHSGTYELFLNYPGIVWLHDVHIANVYLAFSEARFNDDIGAREFMRHTLRHHYATRAPEYLIDHERFSSSAFEQAGARLGADLATKSRGAIVGSELARALLQVDAGPFPRLPPAWVVPFPLPSVQGAAPPATVADTDHRPVIVGLGGVRAEARPELLLEAMTSVVERVPARLVFSGLVDHAYEVGLRRRIAELEMQDHVVMAGQPTSPADDSWLPRAACAVHLRLDRSGATSLAVSESLAHGVPTVTTLSAYAELPPGTLRLLPHDVGPGALSAEIVRLLEDPVERDDLRRGMKDYAATHTFESVADRVLEIALTGSKQVTAR